MVVGLLAVGCASDDGSDGGSAGSAVPATTPAGTAVAAAEDCEPVTDGTDAEAVAAIVEQAVADDDLTSVVYRVTRGDEAVAAGAVGESMAGVPADQTMSFRVGNVAYAYLGTLLLLLAEDGTVALDDPIGTYLPELDLPDADRVTLEMLIRNTSGYPDHVRTDDFIDAFLADPFRDFTTDELIAFGLADPPWFEPGEAWSYSHTGHVLLGLALEAATGQDLATLLDEWVITPMGLTRTAPALTPELPEPALHSYSTERDVLEDTTYWNPSWQTAPGSVVTSTVCDLVVSARAIGSGELLDEASYDALVAPVAVELGPPPASCPEGVCREQTPEQYYGLGVRVAGGWVLQAPLFGGAGGVHAYLPDEDLAVAIQAVTGPGSEPGNPADAIWADIAAELAPDHPVG